jgi:hypothetical protein
MGRSHKKNIAETGRTLGKIASMDNRQVTFGKDGGRRKTSQEPLLRKFFAGA